MSSPNNNIHSLLAILLLLGGNAAHADIAGHVQFVNGAVQLSDAVGKTRSVQKGDVVNEGDTLTSAGDASAQVRMQDGGLVAMRADTKLKFDSFKFSGKQDGSEQSFFSLFKGGFRAVTGLIGQINKPSYRITTPAATIGIRGTDHETFVVLPGSEIAAVAPPGAYNKVNLGETYLATDKGTVFVLPNQMGYAGAKDKMPQLQPINTNLFTVAAEPTPQAEGDRQENKEEGTVRESAVVDNTAQEQAAAPAPAAAAPGNTVAPDIIQLPVETTGGVNLTGGGTTPLVASAPYVQTDMAAAFVTAGQTYNPPFLEIHSNILHQADINNTLPNPSFTDRNAGKDPASYVTYTLSGTTTEGQVATTLANGIQFGRYDSTQSTRLAVGTTNCCAAGTSTSPGAVYSHWITGPAVDPVYLPEVLLVTATYTYAGGTTPTVSSVSTPTAVTLSSATLSVNFTNQLVAFNLGLSNGWTAGTTGTPLEFTYWSNAKTGFRATTLGFSGWGVLTVTGGATIGDVAGQLTGSGLDGALLSYHLRDAMTEVTGVAAFTGTAQAAPTYRLAGLSAADPTPPASTFPGGVYPVGGMVPIPVMLGGYNNSASVTMDGAGNLTGFRSDGGYTSGAYTVGIGAATPTGLATDPVSGISWGRWDGGSFTHNSVIPNGGGIVNTGSAHWIASPVLTGPVSLPVSGTYNYVLAGGTAPTDSLGNIGTLNSASLSANFTAQTVTVGVNVTTAGAGNLIASAANLPIQQKSFFEASTAGAVQGGGAPGSLTLTCGAGCTGTPQGNVVGVFSGSGGIGAAVLYGFAAGATNTTIVNGVAAFHQ